MSAGCGVKVRSIALPLLHQEHQRSTRGHRMRQRVGDVRPGLIAIDLDLWDQAAGDETDVPHVDRCRWCADLLAPLGQRSITLRYSKEE